MIFIPQNSVNKERILHASRNEKETGLTKEQKVGMTTDFLMALKEEAL